MNKTMYKVRQANGELTKDYREILTTQCDFYADLYRSNPNIKFNIVNQSGIFLSEEEKNRLEMPITMEEMQSVLEDMAHDKAPGLDGLTREFYCTFFEELKAPLMRMYYVCFRNKRLNPMARKGVIQLLPKKGKDELLVQNWRPLTLLYYDYKILAKVLTARMDTVMSSLISSQQTGFMKGRHISHNILKTKEIIASLNKAQKPGVIVSVDFEKCFDRVEYSAIRGSLKYFNFGDNFIQWVFLLFNYFTICTKNNGYFSPFISKTWGVNQGCPASPSLYNLNGEIIAHLLKANTDVKGVTVNNVLNILSQFADDTAVFTQVEQLSVQGICNTFQHIEANIGLKISYEKTNMYRIGSLYKTNAQMYTIPNLRWTNDDIQMLGVTFTCDGKSTEKNFTEVIEKIDKVYENWHNKTSTLTGKVLIVNSLIGSLFVYKMTTMSDLTEKQIKTVEGKIRSFLWKGKRARIVLDTLTKDKGPRRLALNRSESKAMYY